MPEHEPVRLGWTFKAFADLAAAEVHEILLARQEVFVVEQDCAFQDADEWDLVSWHLQGREADRGDGRLLAYLRVCPPGSRFAEPSIGRVLTRLEARRGGWGRQALRRGVDFCERQYPGASIRLSAQTYLEKFYSQEGFRQVGEPYDEDGIPHIAMLRAPTLFIF